MVTARRPISLEAAITHAAGHYPPAIANRLARLASALPPPLAWELLDLVEAVDADAHHSGMAAVDREWPRLLAHVPGLAPVLERVRTHAEMPQPAACPVCAAGLGPPATG